MLWVIFLKNQEGRHLLRKTSSAVLLSGEIWQTGVTFG